MLSSRLLPRLSRGSHARKVSLVRPRTAVEGFHSRNYHYLASTNASTVLGGLSSTFHTQDDDPHPSRYQQVRWKRHSGQNEKPKYRRASKKQEKRRRRKKEREMHLSRHSAPGSKAGPLREENATMRDEMLEEYQDRLDGRYKTKQLEANHPLDDPSLEYRAGDAFGDDLIGNAGEWMAQKTPEPIYYGHKQRFFFKQVVNQLEKYRIEVEALPAGSLPPTHLLPGDKDISLAVRAFRDKHGTKRKPVGLAKALSFVLKELGVPSTKLFGEYTYNALLSCCRTPKEGVRIFQLMEQQQHPISAYSFAILVDINAKVGDFEGCVQVMDQMDAAGHEPNLAAYTSLLAACYKVCNDGRIAHEIRARAGEIGWKKWKELRVRGLDPDVMTYGAMIRLCAARGQPEQCLNLLQEMPQFEVKPTTLVFTSALKGIAKSHETAIRYERGFSKANRRRERITAHHGKMAYNVVLLAESAEVKIDDGFIAALQLCAAAAGDSATAKAIYLAHKVRVNMTHMRTIGSDDHLARLRGEDPEVLQLEGGSSPMLQAGDGKGSAVANKRGSKRRHLSFQEREYGGQDLRPLSAILRACAQACTGVGTMWSGRENYGYLDLTSLRLIQEVRKPRYLNTDIPGMTRKEVGLLGMSSVEDMRDPRKRTDPDRKGPRRKYEGFVTEDDPIFTGLHDLPDDMEEQFFEKDGMLKQKYIDTGDYPEYERSKKMQMVEEEKRQALLDQAMQRLQIEAGGELEGETQMYFLEDEQRWLQGDPPKGKNVKYVAVVKHEEVDIDQLPPGERAKMIDGGDEPLQLAAGEEATDSFLDSAEAEKAEAVEDAESWQRKAEDSESKQEKKPKPTLTAFEAEAVEEARQQSMSNVGEDSDFDSDDEIIDEEEYERFMKAASEVETTAEGQFQDPELENDFQDFFKLLQEEEDEDFADMGEAEARQFFVMTKSQFEGDMETVASASDNDSSQEPQMGKYASQKGGRFDDPEMEMEFQQFLELMQEKGGADDMIEESEAREVFLATRGQLLSADERKSGIPATADSESLSAEAASRDSFPTMARGRKPPKREFGEIMEELKEDWGEDGLELDAGEWSDDEQDDGNHDVMTTKELPTTPFAKRQARQSRTRVMEASSELDEELDAQEEYPLAAQSVESFLAENPENEVDNDVELAELRQLLPGLPDSRLRRVKDAYEQDLSDPSLLTLVPILRETMPDWYTIKTIKAANLKNARFVMKQAEEAGLMNKYLLNGMMQVYTSAGSLDSAVALYEDYNRHNASANTYDDRLVVQMFLKNNRWGRCLRFKQWVEEQGRTLDILAYGSLIDHCSRQEQTGSALMMLKECIRIHGAPPGEAYLKRLRILCAKADLVEEVGLEGMIGKDPIEWLKHGESVLRRGRTTKGWPDVNLAKNAIL